MIIKTIKEREAMGKEGSQPPLSDCLRAKMCEDGFWQKILPPLPSTHAAGTLIENEKKRSIYRTARASESLNSNEKILTKLSSKHFLDYDIRDVLPIRVRDVVIMNRAHNLVILPQALLCRGKYQSNVFIMHSCKDADCARVDHYEVVGPTHTLATLPYQWTAYPNSVFSMQVDESGVDYTELIKAKADYMRTYDEIMATLKTMGTPLLELLTIKEEETMGTSAALDKKVLVEKLTVAMGVHEAAIKAAIAESSKRAHTDLDTVLTTGQYLVSEDIVVATAVTKVSDYKNLLEEISLIAGDSVKASDLSKDPISLIRSAGDIKALKVRLKMERV